MHRFLATLQGAKVRFEATAPYIYYSDAWTGLSLLPEKPLVLFLLREPAARTQSQYLFELHRTKRINAEPHLDSPPRCRELCHAACSRACAAVACVAASPAMVAFVCVARARGRLRFGRLGVHGQARA